MVLKRLANELHKKARAIFGFSGTNCEETINALKYSETSYHCNVVIRNLNKQGDHVIENINESVNAMTYNDLSQVCDDEGDPLWVT